MMRADDNDDKSPMAGLYAYFMLSLILQQLRCLL